VIKQHVVEDWPDVKRRWEAWWQRELIDRAIICVTAPRQEARPPKHDDVDPETQWTDVDTMVRRGLTTVAATYYGGEALPMCFNPTSVGHALYFGCPVHYTAGATWVDPAPLGPDGDLVLTGWRQSPWWRWAADTAGAFARGSEGRYFPLPWNGNHTGDILAAIRGVENLMIDIALHPSWVTRAARALSDILVEVHDELWACIVRETTGSIEGSCNHIGAWSPIRTWVFDCDISCMLSPETFGDLFVPPMVEAMQPIHHRIYHLDGPGAIHHLDTLLSIPELHAIEWVPGAGQGNDALTWTPLLRRIQHAGKGVVVSVPFGQVEALLQEVRPEGLCIRTRCPSETEARRLLDRATQVQHPRRLYQGAL